MARRGNPNVTIRMEPKLWETFGEVADDRSAMIRDFVRWYVREPGARMPRRPGQSRDSGEGETSAYSPA